jgi:arabinofuranosyltransferase
MTSIETALIPAEPRDLPLKALVVLFFLFYAMVTLRAAWLSDDAYITLRTVDNFVHGYGLTWNIAERVQVYTHPLWMFVLAAAYCLTREAYFTVLFLSLAVSFATAWIFAFRIARTAHMAVLGLLLLSFSKAFTEYSTSGLENPASHLLLALFWMVYLNQEPTLKRLYHLSVLAALAAFNRIDTLLFYLPALVLSFQAMPRGGRLKALFQGFLPFFLWEGFCLFYYGFLFPNTAYAKLSTGIHFTELLHQGFCYFLNSLNLDPVTLLVISFGLSVPRLTQDKRLVPLALGAGLYLLYILWIGGDFMTGRFFSTVLLGAVCLISMIQFKDIAQMAPAFLLVLFVGAFSPHVQYLLDLDHPLSTQFPVIDNKGIADERAFYRTATGLSLYSRNQPLPYQAWVLEGRDARKNGTAVAVRDNIGFFGYYAGPEVYVLDKWALADPLLARLPMSALEWRIGHFARTIPEGYVETVENGENRIQDPNIKAYFEKLKRINRGPLLDGGRFLEILRMNLGWYDYLVDPPA